ncbi:MAG: 3-oxoacyl-ACP reductase FabG [Clostridia bacterium]|nr:3-oxoacyl-ACP reductase FabG [Clostridia bacterium]
MEKVLITGGTRGIGRKTAELFKKSGYDVFVTFKKSSDEAEKLKAEGISAIKADVSDIEAMEDVRQKIGAVDVLVNNAGISYWGLLSEMTAEQWQRVIDVNLTGTFNCIKVFSPDMVKKKSGAIVNLSSMWGVTGGSCEAAYSAAKAGIIGLTKALAKELGPSKVRVNAVAPGVIKTDMTKNLSEEDLNSLAEETPLGIIGTAQDIAEGILYLAKAQFVTGEILNINGGIVI